MRPWDTILKYIPFKKEQSKAGVSWAVPKVAAPPPNGEIVTPALPQTVPLPPPAAAAVPPVSPAASSAVDSVLKAAALAPAAVPAAPPAEGPAPAADASKKAPEKLMDIFVQDEAEITPLMGLTASLPEVDAASLLEACRETKEKLLQRC